MKIINLSSDNKQEALELVLRVFMEYEGKDYSKEGIQTFKDSVINNQEYIDNINMYGAYEENKLVGVIATRSEGNHITLFFVEGKCHRKGIGKELFKTILKDATAKEITVNSSPYAKEVYQNLGFTQVQEEQVENGIRYIPMVYKIDTEEIEKLIGEIDGKGKQEVFEALKRLEEISDESSLVYKYLDKFIEMIQSDKYVVRVRGFRLLCKQARWDTDNLIDENIEDVMTIFDDEKPTAVRQALAAVSDIVKYKKDLHKIIREKVKNINYLRYNDSMRGLISKDIKNVIDLIEENN